MIVLLLRVSLLLLLLMVCLLRRKNVLLLLLLMVVVLMTLRCSLLLLMVRWTAVDDVILRGNEVGVLRMSVVGGMWRVIVLLGLERRRVWGGREVQVGTGRRRRRRAARNGFWRCHIGVVEIAWDGCVGVGMAVGNDVASAVRTMTV